MKMDITEFKSRLGEVTEHEQPVTITDRDRIVAHYLPVSQQEIDKLDIDGWARARLTARAAWIDRTPDWVDRLLRFGLDDDGEPFENETRR